MILLLTKVGIFGDPSKLSTHYKASTYQDFTICIEMVLAAIAYSYTFSYADFLDITKSPRPILSNLKIVQNLILMFALINIGFECKRCDFRGEKRIRR